MTKIVRPNNQDVTKVLLALRQLLSEEGPELPVLAVDVATGLLSPRADGAEPDRSTAPSHVTDHRRRAIS